jgi:hypothetical protein
VGEPHDESGVVAAYGNLTGIKQTEPGSQSFIFADRLCLGVFSGFEGQRRPAVNLDGKFRDLQPVGHLF